MGRLALESANDGYGVGSSSSLGYCPDGYWSGSHQYDAHARRSADPYPVEVDGLFCLPPQGGVGRPTPNGFAGDGLGKTPTHTARTGTYAHPYTMEKRQAVLDISECSLHFLPVGKAVLFDFEVEEINSFITGAGLINKNCFDEAAQVPEEVVRYHIGWLRSVVDSQRTRVVLGSNPPTDPTGEYLVGMFRPWLDPTHPKPAEDGELRWYAKDPDGDEIEVEGPEPIRFPGQSDPVKPMSRTFIRSRLQDNPYLSKTDYQSRLDQMDEPYRSAMRDGKFMGARKDQPDQIIPAAWVKEAQDRWTRKPPQDARMTAIGLDVGQGGVDRVVAAPRYGTWYAPLEVAKGKDAPDGPSQVAFIARFRRDNAPVVVDVGGGFGGDACSVFKSNSVPYYRFNGVEAALGKAKDGSGRGFENRRAEAWWRFREALNPDQPGGSDIALPPDPELLYELTAPMLVPYKRAIQIENKKEIKARLKRSIDKADAVVMAWAPGDSAARRRTMAQGGVMTLQSKANIGYAEIKRVGAP
jgi:hypothetical protein